MYILQLAAELMQIEWIQLEMELRSSNLLHHNHSFCHDPPHLPINRFLLRI